MTTLKTIRLSQLKQKNSKQSGQWAVLGFWLVAERQRRSRREEKACFWVLWAVSNDQEAGEVEGKGKKIQAVPGENGRLRRVQVEKNSWTEDRRRKK